MFVIRLIRSETFRLMLAGFVAAAVGLTVSLPGDAQAGHAPAPTVVAQR